MSEINIMHEIEEINDVKIIDVKIIDKHFERFWNSFRPQIITALKQQRLQPMKELIRALFRAGVKTAFDHSDCSHD